LETVQTKAKITGGAVSQCDGGATGGGGVAQGMIIGTTALLRALQARPAQGMTSRAKTPAHPVVRITSGATPGMTHGNIVVLKLRHSKS